MKPSLKVPNLFYIKSSNHGRLKWDKKFYHKLIFKSLSQYYYYQREQHKTEEIIFLVSSLYFMLALNVYPSKTKKNTWKDGPLIFHKPPDRSVLTLTTSISTMQINNCKTRKTHTCQPQIKLPFTYCACLLCHANNYIQQYY